MFCIVLAGEHMDDTHSHTYMHRYSDLLVRVISAWLMHSIHSSFHIIYNAFVQIFVKDNQGGEETTVINHIGLFGSPLDATRMSEFKRVAGEKGERHQ